MLYTNKLAHKCKCAQRTRLSVAILFALCDSNMEWLHVAEEFGGKLLVITIPAVGICLLWVTVCTASPLYCCTSISNGIFLELGSMITTQTLDWGSVALMMQRPPCCICGPVHLLQAFICSYQSVKLFSPSKSICMYGNELDAFKVLIKDAILCQFLSNHAGYVDLHSLQKNAVGSCSS